MDDLGTLSLDPAEAIPEGSLDFSFHRINLVLGYALFPLSLGMVETPRVGHGWRSAVTRPSHLRRNRWQMWVAPPAAIPIGFELPVAAVRPESLHDVALIGATVRCGMRSGFGVGEWGMGNIYKGSTDTWLYGGMCNCNICLHFSSS